MIMIKKRTLFECDLNISEVTVTPEYFSFGKLSLTAAEEIFVDGGNVSLMMLS